MTLGELIACLEKLPRDLKVPVGFHRPHSYRGYYPDLAFEPLADTTAGAMLDCARSALGATYQGWKGGDFTMSADVDCWIAWEGAPSYRADGIGPLLLSYMTGDPRVPEEED